MNNSNRCSGTDCRLDFSKFCVNCRIPYWDCCGSINSTNARFVVSTICVIWFVSQQNALNIERIHFCSYMPIYSIIVIIVYVGVSFAIELHPTWIKLFYYSSYQLDKLNINWPNVRTSSFIRMRSHTCFDLLTGHALTFQMSVLNCRSWSSHTTQKNKYEETKLKGTITWKSIEFLWEWRFNWKKYKDL